MEYKNIDILVDGAKATITINRPKALNALNSNTLAEIGVAFSELEASEVRVCIITGAGEKAFVAGADIAELKECNVMGAKQLAELGHELFKQIEDSVIITIAAINGFALGGGCELALSADIRLASETARLGQPEVSLGIIPGFGGTQRLARLVGKGRAKELILTGRMVDAAEALRIGLVEAVYPADRLIEEAGKLADTILAKGPLAVQFAKKAINIGLDFDLANASQYEIISFAALFGTADKDEGLTAFLEKRKAEFKGK
ncbi:MAG: enoyl-CoA hydratase/isomerase family protein [candidate division Zixibacteria bacterium]|nr:enoyl-CoA hydratase/isomerase family protein [candidate division Zixibacteria bacterium]